MITNKNGGQAIINSKSIAPNTIELIMVDKKGRQKTHEWVYGVLRHNLICGKIPPGLPLTIRGLAKRLKVSAMPVREALNRLTSEGALQSKDNGRVLVPRMTPEKFKALCELRILLETHAAENALPYVREQHIVELESLDDAVDAALNQGNIELTSLNNQAFHRYLYTIDPFQVCQAMIESNWLQLGPFVRIAKSKLETHYPIDRHREAIAAIKNQNAFGLRRAIEADIRDGIASIEAVAGGHDYFNGVGS